LCNSVGWEIARLAPALQISQRFNGLSATLWIASKRCPLAHSYSYNGIVANGWYHIDIAVSISPVLAARKFSWYKISCLLIDCGATAKTQAEVWVFF